MENILEELFYGNIRPSEKEFIKDSEYDKAMHLFSEKEEKLTKILKDNDKKLFFDFINAQMDLNFISEKEYFIDGFRLGAKIMLEILTDKSENLQNIV